MQLAISRLKFHIPLPHDSMTLKSTVKLRKNGQLQEEKSKDGKFTYITS